MSHQYRPATLRAFLVVGMLIIFAVAQRPSETRLLAKATVVTKLPVQTHHSFVLTDGTILTTQRLEHNQYILSQVQPKTGSILSHQPIESTFTIGILQFDCLLSPDGHNLLWAQKVGNNYRWVVFDVITKQYKTIAVSSGDSMEHPSAIWSTDSTQIVELSGPLGKQRLAWHELANPMTPRTYDLPKTPDWIWMVGAKSKDTVILGAGEGLYEVTCRDSKLDYEQIDKPGGSRFTQSVISPSGEYCAWVTNFHPFGVLGESLDRLAKKPLAEQWGVYVGKVGEMQINFVGALPAANASDTSVNNLLWSSDEHSLSFEYGGSLYLVPCR